MPDTDTPTDTPSARLQQMKLPLVIAVVALLIAGSLSVGLALGGRDEEEPAMATTPTLPPTATTSTTAAEPSEVPIPRSPRGHIVKQLGEVGGFTHPEDTTPSTTELVLSFTIDAIRPVDCSSPYAEAPQNGNFIALDIRASTAENYPADVLPFWVSSGDFSVVGPDGVTVSNLGTPQSFMCMDYNDPNLFTQDQFTPASQYRGTVILDVPTPTGTLIFTPLGATSGWEWSF